MKKLISILLCLTFCTAILCSCDKKDGGSVTTAGGETAANAEKDSDSKAEKKDDAILTDDSCYEYTEIEGGIAITYFQNYDKISYDKIIIPSQIDGKTVISIGERGVSSRVMGAVFGKCEVVIPDTVTYIGKNAFAGAGGLVKVSGGANCSEIDEGAFSNCWYLTEVTFLDHVAKVADDAFGGSDAWLELHSDAKK